MARLKENDKLRLIADISTGQYSVRDLASKYGVSVATVQKYKPELDPRSEQVVNAGIAYKTGLAEIGDAQKVNAIVNAVDERTKHVQFFTDATVVNIKGMVDKLGKETSIIEHRIAQAAIKDGRETVLGKSPDVAVQVNNNMQPIDTPAEFAQIARTLINEI